MEKPLSIAFVLLPNFTMTPFAALLDMVRLAADEGDRSRPIRLAWTIVGVSLEPVRSSAGVEVRPWETLGDPARFDYVVVCGGLLQRDRRGDPAILDWLQRAAAGGANLVALCTAVFALGEAGLLAGRRACVSWYHVADFRAAFADVEPVGSDLYIDDGPIITCSGGTGAADVGALIVARHLGAATARKALDILQVEAPRAAAHPQPAPSLADDIGIEAVRRAVLIVEGALDRNIPVAALARAVGVSRRQLERLFLAATGQSPSAFVAALRLRYADWMIRGGEASMTEIAQACGFADSSHLSRRYRTAYGLSPSAARRGGGRFAPGERRPYADPPAIAATKRRR